MKIGIFSESYKPYISGVTISIETLINELRLLGHEVFIFAPHHPEAEVDPNIFRFPSIKSYYPGFRLSLPFSRSILKKIPELELDIIHTHSPYQTGLLALYFAKKLKIPIVYTLHTLFKQYLHYIPLLPKPLAEHLLTRYLRSFCNNCNAVIAPTKVVKDLLLKDGVKSHIEVLPTGIDISQADNFSGQGIREKHNIKKDENLLLFVGRLSKEKNLIFLLDAFSLILKEIPNCHLMLVAKGPYENALKAHAKKLGISNKLTFVGEVKFPFVFDYYKAADLFVFSSLTETQGLVLAEAKTAGLPIVAVDAEGASEMVWHREDGYLVKHDLNEFAASVVELLLNEELRKQMSKRALVISREILSSKAMAIKAEKLYLSLIK